MANLGNNRAHHCQLIERERVDRSSQESKIKVRKKTSPSYRREYEFATKKKKKLLFDAQGKGSSKPG